MSILQFVPFSIGKLIAAHKAAVTVKNLSMFGMLFNTVSNRRITRMFVQQRWCLTFVSFLCVFLQSGVDDDISVEEIEDVKIVVVVHKPNFRSRRYLCRIKMTNITAFPYTHP